jgi:hypothetical protein
MTPSLGPSVHKANITRTLHSQLLYPNYAYQVLTTPQGRLPLRGFAALGNIQYTPLGPVLRQLEFEDVFT